MRRIYFIDYHPAGLADILTKGCNIKHPRIQLANKLLKANFNAKIKRMCVDYAESKFVYYAEFSHDEDIIAFKLAHGY